MKLRDLLDIRIHTPPLDPYDVHIWRSTTEIPSGDLLRLESLLSTDERERAARFHFERDRRRFVACRGCLRLLAAAYLGERAERIRFRYGHQGKPALWNPNIRDGNPASRKEQSSNLQFSVSHSGELALLAFSRGSEIGVDAEYMRPDLEFLPLARSSFSPLEYEALAAADPGRRAALFYDYWSCKEACIKADGRGVSVGLDQFTVCATDQPLWRSVCVAPPCGLSPEMRVRILDVGESYAAAVAAARAGWNTALLSLE